MTQARPTRILLLVFVLAIAFRWALYHSGLVDVVLFTGDSGQYHELAKSLLRGQFAEGNPPVPSMNRTPGYPGFLALIYALLGESGTAITAAQILLDAVTCVMVIHMALVLGLGRRGLVVTAALAVTCLFTAAIAFQIMTETLNAFFIVAAAWFLLPAGGRGDPIWRTTPTHAFASGLMFGLGILVRPALAVAALLFVAVTVGYDAWHHRAGLLSRLGRLVLIPALISVGILIPVLPWMVRNYLTFPEVYRAAEREHVALLGYKGSNENYRHFFIRGFADYLLSYEEPFVQLLPFEPPLYARYVYAGEEEEVRAAFAKLAKDVAELRHFRWETLPLFEAIRVKRYAATPRLYITAPLSKLLKIWITPRIALLWKGRSGLNSSLSLTVVLTLYSVLYAVLGFLGLWWGLRQASPVLFLFVVAMVLAHTWVHAIWLPFPISRYAVPLFPLLSLAAGAFVSRPRRAHGGDALLKSAVAPAAGAIPGHTHPSSMARPG